MTIPLPFQLNSDNNATLIRCSGGYVLDMPTGTPNFIDGGFFQAKHFFLTPI
jgi:hypothetical protein